MKQITDSETNNQVGVLLAQIARHQKSITYYQLLLSQLSTTDKINALRIDLGISHPSTYDYAPLSPADKNRVSEAPCNIKITKTGETSGDTTSSCNTLKMQRGQAQLPSK